MSSSASSWRSPPPAACRSSTTTARAPRRRHVPKPDVNRFAGRAAYRSVKRQLALGPRPAGSPASRRLAERLVRALPDGRLEDVPGHPGLRNVIGTLPGRDPDRLVVLGAHYDTKDIPGFLGANDGASGTAIVARLARTLKPRRLEPTVEFILFDGEESPAGTPDSQFAPAGPSRQQGGGAALPRGRGDDPARLRGREGPADPARGLVLAGAVEPAAGRRPPRRSRRRCSRAARRARSSTTTCPSSSRACPSIDLIDFDFPCFHRTCDNLSRISPRSLDASGRR